MPDWPIVKWAVEMTLRMIGANAPSAQVRASKESKPSVVVNLATLERPHVSVVESGT